MNFGYSQKVETLRHHISTFMKEHIVPRHAQWLAETHAGCFPATFMEELKAKARSEGLWNLFLPHLKHDEPGTALTNLEYAPLAEIMGRISWAPEVFNCNAPDTGNMELLHMFATPAQREQWLKPLLEGTIRSAFAMTEPDVPSSDATNITTSIRRDGDDYVINGRKWFITNAAHPNCKIFIVMGKTNPDAETHQQQSMILVPAETPGVKVIRNIPVMNHISPEGHCEMTFTNVRVPATNLLGEEGSGFSLAQARLGPGRIHHCMRSIGAAELALELMIERSQERKTFGKYLHQHGTIGEWIAKSRIEIDQARLLVLKTAWLIDEVGAKAARKEISMIKALVPQLHTTVCDRAMQVFGAMGLSPDTPLADHWTWGRALRYADGPDEVHLQAIARMELAQSKATPGAAAAYLTVPPRD
ncbi:MULTISPECIES: acyl-CoA dehydrogenase family protein [Paraburkholderia]|jgi:acyl-CoA dehydrogenase|uniref:Acyl-CoA dehydrogenase n=1 Tax=Paraburkholderia caribensis TaxID=75105 RepID=A0A9Q6S7G1_9BURK|nr:MULTISPECIES: acyl-CoA dehydrogenase family protein [Paraburkholderia]MCO4882011.1 acyl-CoA dehydrogenase family protein [Paraburkholderia caribensis]PTB30222.1 acyl-CoA dehydrogenase [Paraburkholderia caribensis]QLB65916.1 acyl-CoA dehydrogenase [Paraburkholderia caribensis]